jgi:hypothetical protein
LSWCKFWLLNNQSVFAREKSRAFFFARIQNSGFSHYHGRWYFKGRQRSSMMATLEDSYWLAKLLCAGSPPNQLCGLAEIILG